MKSNKNYIGLEKLTVLIKWSVLILNNRRRGWILRKPDFCSPGFKEFNLMRALGNIGVSFFKLNQSQTEVFTTPYIISLFQIIFIVALLLSDCCLLIGSINRLTSFFCLTFLLKLLLCHKNIKKKKKPVMSKQWLQTLSNVLFLIPLQLDKFFLLKHVKDTDHFDFK